jgi:hypothetical protein
MERWFWWGIPNKYIRRYIFLMMMILVMLPLLTGLRYTQVGYILNILFADVMFYRWCHKKIEEDKAEERIRRFRDGE